MTGEFACSPASLSRLERDFERSLGASSPALVSRATVSIVRIGLASLGAIFAVSCGIAVDDPAADSGAEPVPNSFVTLPDGGAVSECVGRDRPAIVPRDGTSRCRWRNPDNSGSEFFGFGRLNYDYVKGSGERIELVFVGESEACARAKWGWFDEPASRMFGLCASTCDDYLDDRSGSIVAVISCATRKLDQKM